MSISQRVLLGLYVQPWEQKTHISFVWTQNSVRDVSDIFGSSAVALNYMALYIKRARVNEEGNEHLGLHPTAPANVLPVLMCSPRFH